jgi:hypothetical protein
MPDNAISRYNKKKPALTFRVDSKTKDLLLKKVKRSKIFDPTYSLNKLLSSILDEWLEKNNLVVITREYKE